MDNHFLNDSQFENVIKGNEEILGPIVLLSHPMTYLLRIQVLIMVLIQILNLILNPLLVWSILLLSFSLIPDLKSNAIVRNIGILVDVDYKFFSLLDESFKQIEVKRVEVLVNQWGRFGSEKLGSQTQLCLIVARGVFLVKVVVFE